MLGWLRAGLVRSVGTVGLVTCLIGQRCVSGILITRLFLCLEKGIPSMSDDLETLGVSTPDEDVKPERRRLIAEVGTVEFMSELFSFFGPHRALQLMGWAVLWGVTGVENGPEFRAKLKERGISQATAYRASLDFRRFRDHVEFRMGHPVTMEEVLSELKSTDGVQLLASQS